METHICTICGESKDPSKARFAHVRLGLDEPPEPVLCKCKDPIKIFSSIQTKVNDADKIKTVIPNMVMDSLAQMNINTALIDSVSTKPMREVELRVVGVLAETMFKKMEKGLFENETTSTITEMGCTCWTGSESNANARVRKRSNGEAIVKISRSRHKVAPGYIIAISDEYSFSGRIMHVQYNVEMTEIRSVIRIRDVNVNVIARKYGNEDRISFAGEFEINGKATNSIVRATLCLALGTIGTTDKMRTEIDEQFMNDVRGSDHVVVDVPDMMGYTGNFLAKADGVKVYIFCYEFGYVITIPDPMLTMVTCVATVTHKDLPEMTNTPDVVVAEMMMDGTLVYIDTLAMNGIGRLSKSTNTSKCPFTTEKPNLIYRTVWNEMPNKIQLDLEPMPNDGVVLTNKFRTLRLKEPTIDLMYMDGKLNSIENGVMIEITDGHPSMEQETIYELDVVKDKDTGDIKLVKPRERPLKKMPNNIDVVRRAISTANADPTMNTTLLDITAMSFSMRERVYLMAQSKASENRNVIVTFGVGRFQEWKQMLNSNCSYIAIDPELDYSDLERRTKTVRILPYDFGRKFETQTIAISKGKQTVLWAKCTSEEFIRRTMPTRIMNKVGIPAVFSFSISFHIQTITMLRTEGVKMYGCGFVHDSISGTVGRTPVTMTLKDKRRGMNSEVVATFGKSTYIEPFLKMSTVPGLVLVKDAMPDLWERVDTNTIEIMDRAVIMSA